MGIDVFDSLSAQSASGLYVLFLGHTIVILHGGDRVRVRSVLFFRRTVIILH